MTAPTSLKPHLPGKLSNNDYLLLFSNWQNTIIFQKHCTFIFQFTCHLILFFHIYLIIFFYIFMK